MRIDQDVCVGCEQCVPYCPVSAINATEGKVTIDEDLCVECTTCLRSSHCPVDALIDSEDVDKWPRSIRKLFSDPSTTHPVTQVNGRGTEEVKTNDVTGIVKRGERAFCVEMGRPGVGAHLADVEKVTMALAALGVKFQERNPLYSLFKDKKTGEIIEDVKRERVLSMIIEFAVNPESIGKLMETIEEVSQKIETVFSLDCLVRVDPDGGIPVLHELKKIGYAVSPWLKMNMGLGRPLAKE